MFRIGTRKWFVKKKNEKPSVKKKWKKKWVANILKQHRERILEELDVNKVLPYLVYNKVFSLTEYKEILGYDTNAKRAEIFLDQLSSKGPGAFCSFCLVLEEVCPHLLTCFLLNYKGTFDFRHLILSVTLPLIRLCEQTFDAGSRS